MLMLSVVSCSAEMTILKNVPRILPPRLIYAMAQMGHGDELVSCL